MLILSRNTFWWRLCSYSASPAPNEFTTGCLAVKVRGDALRVNTPPSLDDWEWKRCARMYSMFTYRMYSRFSTALCILPQAFLLHSSPGVISSRQCAYGCVQATCVFVLEGAWRLLILVNVCITALYNARIKIHTFLWSPYKRLMLRG